MISRHRPDGRILYVSPSCEQVLGFPQADLVGRYGRDLVHPDDLAAVVGPDGRPRDMAPLQDRPTVRLRHRDGHWLWAELHAQLLRDAEGEVEQIQIRVLDITERCPGRGRPPGVEAGVAGPIVRGALARDQLTPAGRR